MIDYQKVFTRIPDIVGFPDIRFIRGSGMPTVGLMVQNTSAGISLCVDSLITEYRF